MKVEHKRNIFTPKELDRFIQAAQKSAADWKKAGHSFDSIYTSIARGVAEFIHEGQTQKVGGAPFVEHPYFVGDQFPENMPLHRQAAYLHDTIEKSNLTLDHLRRMGFDERVVQAVGLLTHDKEQPYLNYIMALSTDPIARAVKRADFKHNTQPDRIRTDLSPERKELYVIGDAYLEALDEGRIPLGYSIRIFASTEQFLGRRLATQQGVARADLYNIISGAVTENSTPPFIRQHEFSAPMPLAS